ncbi:MAG: Glutamyl-tRNA reductase [Methanomassiliicoccales archaeon PtaU1.Bin030]|nr:MAG: Glutamyl-tRNA reductase [Methanomassiliicoccales archaeon PtaU1.Bin030]
METILSAHITHKQARVADMERLGRIDPELMLRNALSLPGATECIVLRTCNRMELYLATRDPNATRRGLEDMINGLVPFDAEQNLVQYLNGKESVRHILRVSSGLESLIVGEDQIQCQVKEAFDLAKRHGSVGPVLTIVFQKAISVGKLVRSRTNLNKGCVSIGTAAVELAEEKVGSLAGKNILVVGAGEMATLIAKHLVGKGPKAVFVSNRTYSRAVELAWVLNGKAVRFDSLVEFFSQADVVLVATSASHMIITPALVRRAQELRKVDSKFLIIDVSFPRNVEPQVAELEGVELYDIDGLRGKAEENLLRRRSEIRGAELIISQELESLGARMKEMKADEILGRLYGKYFSLRDREVRKALNRLSSGREPAEVVLKDFADVITRKFLADPTVALKDACREGNEDVFEKVQSLFKLEGATIVPTEQTSKAASETEH